MQGRGLKLHPHKGIKMTKDVAPHAGAWIETQEVAKVAKDLASPLMQGRGLKLARHCGRQTRSRRPSCRGVD